MRMLRILVALLLVKGATSMGGQTQDGVRSNVEATAVIDTMSGRLKCRLFETERPKMVAEFIGLAQGTTDWIDPVSGAAVRGKPFYDGTKLYSIPAGVRGGSRSDIAIALPGAGLVWETEPAMRFDRPGRLAMRREKGQTGGTEFMILDHANSEDDGESATIFGQCDEASIALVTAISHRLAATDNRPERPIMINRVMIVRDGLAMPARAEDIPPGSIVSEANAMPSATVPSPQPTGPRAFIQTTMGRLTCKLFSKESPIATNVFMGLAEGTKEWTNPLTKQVEHGKRFYDGMPFDRVIPDFVIQSGDVTGDISGGTDIGFRFKNENAPGLNFDRPGRLAFGNDGPDTNSSEIFISEHPMRRLNGGFTIIGQCDDASVRLVEKIARVARNANNRPITPVLIQSIHFDHH